MIHIIDDFLNETEINELNIILENKMYKYGHTSGLDEKPVTPFFASYNKDSFFFNIKEKIERTFEKKYKIIRHYMHIQTLGQNVGFHIDDEGLNKYTFCLYVTSETNMENIGGDFLIKIPNEKYIYSIETKMNRGLLFPSHYVHKGMSYNIYSFKPRLCITWKLELIN